MLATTMAAACWSCPTTLPRLPSLYTNPTLLQSTTKSTNFKPLIIPNSSNSTTPLTSISWSETEQESESEGYESYTEDDDEEEDDEASGSSSSSSAAAAAMAGHAPPMRTRRRRYRKEYPGEKKGITEEMRFVTMKLKNSGKPKAKGRRNKGSLENGGQELSEVNDGNDDIGDGGESWEPSIEGFLKYLVDSKLVFSTLESIVDESSDVSYAYFRKTGLERAESISKDLEWFSQQGNSIPEPSNPGITYAKYLEEIAENNPPLFMSHFYNIYFSHIAGGQVIAKKVSEKLLEGKELEFFKWEKNEEELLRDTREKLNMLGEHWSRDETNKCLREATKAFRFLGQIVRLIIL